MQGLLCTLDTLAINATSIVYDLQTRRTSKSCQLKFLQRLSDIEKRSLLLRKVKASYDRL